MTIVVLVVLSVWFVVSAANQIPGPWIAWLGRLNAVTVLPSNSFFAPDPVDVDYHLVYRDFDGDEQLGPWREAPINRDGWLRFFWSTSKRDHQAILATVSGLGGIQQFVAPVVADPEALMQVSLPYLFLLHRARAQARDPRAKERQFMVVESRGFGERRDLELAILSNSHCLD